jgi:TonB-dependent receptor
MNLRFAYSTGLARPSYNSLVPYVFRDDEAREVSKGNPDLEPTKANNFDLMFENYGSYLSLFSAGLFYKTMTDVIVSSRTIEDLEFEGQIYPYEVTMPINGSDDATIYGIELAANQRLNFLGSSFLENFTIYANYTYTKSEFKVEDREVPLGFSPENILNIALMYDNSDIGLSFVISNNFRDDILIAVGSDKYSDVYYKNEYHLDLSVNQRITDNFKIYLQLNNLTDQFENESFGDPAESYSKWTQWAKFGSYGTLGVSFKL